MNLDDESFDASTFAKNKERLLEAEVARLFFDGVVSQAKTAGLISAEASEERSGHRQMI